MAMPAIGLWQLPVQRAPLLAILLVGGSTAAGAQEFCVACTEPSQVYRCVIDRAVPTGIPLKLPCVGTLAREGPHASCSVRGGTVFECAGPVRRIDARQAADLLSRPPPATAEGQVPAPQRHAASPQKAEEPPVRPAASPRTVEELARQVSRDSGDAIGKAGATVVEQSRRAWSCVASLFKAC